MQLRPQIDSWWHYRDDWLFPAKLQSQNQIAAHPMQGEVNHPKENLRQRKHQQIRAELLPMA